MALSNIFREPQREITESVVGLGAFLAFVGADYIFACWLQAYVGFHEHTGKNAGLPFGPDCYRLPFPVAMLGGVIAMTCAAMVLFVTHAIGDGICNALQARGIHLRPRQRK